MERLRGAPLTDLDAVRSITAADPEGVLIAALNVWAASVVGAESFHADVHAGNLLVLPDGRVGFIDFGIVGEVSPATWRGLEALAGALAAGDYATAARALGAIGATDDAAAAGGAVDYDAFARDLEAFVSQLDLFSAGLTAAAAAAAAAGGGPDAAAAAALGGVDQAAANRLALELVRIGEAHGVRFPPDFGLLLKQALYFDRYVRALAPGLQVMTDERVRWRGDGGGGGGVTSGASGGGGGFGGGGAAAAVSV